MAHEGNIHVPKYSRPHKPKFVSGLEIVPIWRHRGTTQHIRVVKQTVEEGGGQRRVIFQDYFEGRLVEVALPWEQFVQQFEPVGNRSSQF